MRTPAAEWAGVEAREREPRCASFRDPAGRILLLGERVFRVVHPAAVDELEGFAQTRACCHSIETGRLVRTHMLTDSEARAVAAVDGGRILEHERIPFASYPYEWPAEMLCAAGTLTLDLAGSLLAEGYGLKDATPYNVLFQGPRPVFVDWLSFEKRDPQDPTWLAYAQFCRCFLLPLASNKHLGVPLDQLLLGRRDGVEPEEAYRWAGPLRRWFPPFLTLATIPVWLSASRNCADAGVYRKRRFQDAERAQFVLRGLFGRLRRILSRLAPEEDRSSRWSGYMEQGVSYSTTQLAAKAEFVERTLEEFRPGWVLDAGANTGYFSAVAARRGGRVVAIDSDPVAAGRAWRRAWRQDLDILPLVVNLARPSPPTGWRNSECPSFLERARGRFDTVLMLALLHHLLVSERVPLEEVVDLAAELTRDLLVIEYVGTGDPMFRRITRGREDLHRGLTQESFEQACSCRFEIVRSRQLEGMDRCLYAMRKRTA